MWDDSFTCIHMPEVCREFGTVMWLNMFTQRSSKKPEKKHLVSCLLFFFCVCVWGVFWFLPSQIHKKICLYQIGIQTLEFAFCRQANKSNLNFVFLRVYLPAYRVDWKLLKSKSVGLLNNAQPLCWPNPVMPRYPTGDFNSLVISKQTKRQSLPQGQ